MQWALMPALLLSCVSAVNAGSPPLVTDDSGVLGQGGWEYILGLEEDRRDAGDSYLLPRFEVAYGFTDAMQGAVTISRLVVDEPGASSRSDFDALGFEFKWQFHAGEKLSFATAPGYSFPLTDSSTDRGLVDDVRVLSLPLIATYEIGKWAFDGNLGYEVPSSGRKAVFGGLTAVYQLTDTLQVMGEVYRVDVSGAQEDEANWTIGFDLAINDGLALLFSVGGNIDSNLPRAEELDRAAFIGLRYETS